jgi:hypothetical protein
MESNDLVFCQRPTLVEGNRKGQPIKLISNYLNISFKPNNSYIRQYHLKFQPEIAHDNDILRRSIIRGLRNNEDFRKDFNPFVISGDSLFSPHDVEVGFNPISIVVPRQNGDSSEFLVTIIKTNNQSDISNVKTNFGFSQKVKSLVDVIFKNILSANRGMIRFNKKSIYNYENTISLRDNGKYFKSF